MNCHFLIAVKVSLIRVKKCGINYKYKEKYFESYLHLA
jgi:hypothetical protein